MSNFAKAKLFNRVNKNMPKNNIEKEEIIRHSLSHIMASSVQELYPGTKFGIGPAIENGFYYDFEFKKPIIAEDLVKIEKKMKELLKKDISFKKKLVSKNEAKKLFSNQPYKLELIKELPGKKVSIYQSGDFSDLCKGPHIKSTKEISFDSFKLTKIAGAYWRGSEKNKMLTRIYGVAFKTKTELDEYLHFQEEAEKRDHRVLGQKLDLFSISDEVGAGLVILHPKGAAIRNAIEVFWKKEHKKRGYQYVYSPHIGKLDLWRTSGHWEFYRENLYSPIEIEGVQYLLKPMNCPFHLQVYKSKIRSYKDLPLRYCELGTVYRFEKTGVLHGLLRVRGFTQDDAHIFCTPQQIDQEVERVIDLACFMLNTFGFPNFKTELSVRDPKNKKKYLGSDKIWQKAENALEYALKQKGLKYKRAEGEAVFYGPKIDIKLIDALNRGWQGPTIQVDFNLPEKFGLNYINEKGKKERVVMIHHTVLGSIERFMGNLLEQYAGALPLWLAPIQAWIIPIGSRHEEYAKKIGEELLKNNSDLRIEIKSENETVSKKIREGEIQKIPYLLVVGDQEMKAESVRVRSKNKDLGMMKIKGFLEKVSSEIKEKK
jgi:threonyl-tRNA synthetase